MNLEKLIDVRPLVEKLITYEYISLLSFNYLLSIFIF